MTDPRGAPRRVSLGYILGFSDKPFKDPKPPAPPPSPPRPRKPSQLTNLVSSPGGIVEWTASDGRKGRLTGTGKPRLTATSLAKVSSERGSMKDILDAKSGSNKVTDNVKGAENKGGTVAAVAAQQQAATGGAAQVAEASGAAAATNDEAKKNNDSSTWTKEEDAKLMQMKTGSANLPWAAAAAEIGKTVQECKTRFKTIKSDGCKPRTAKGGDENKKSRSDNQNQAQSGNQNDKKKEDEKKEEDPADVSVVVLGGFLGGDTDDKKAAPGRSKDPNAWDTRNDGWNITNTGDAVKDGCEAANSGGTGGANDAADSWGAQGGTGGGTQIDMGATWDNPVEGGAVDNKDAGDAWGNATWGGDGGAATFEDTAKDQNGAAAEGVLAPGWGPTAAQDSSNNNNNTSSGDGLQASNTDPWTTAIKPASSRHSTRAPSQSRSRNSAPANPTSTSTRPLELEIKPDDVFSADDLRLVARILQQDCSMVWNRVSWRFRDKTGRTLHADVFEKKITGQLESKSSERSERRK